MFDQDEYLEMLNLEDKYTKSLSVWEVSRAFPDCREIAARHAYCLTIDLTIYDDHIKKEPLLAEFIKIDPRYKRLEALKQYLHNTRRVVGRKELDIDKARRFPIQELYDFGKGIKFGKRMKFSCPLHHGDNTPSFVIYLDQNKYFCFGCNSGGSPIDFVMNLHNVGFKDAVNIINGE